MTTWNEIAVSLAQLAAGGGIVQALVAWTRRRKELRHLDEQSDSVAVETSTHVITMLRAELDKTKADAQAERAAREAEAADLRQRVNGERTARDREVQELRSQVSELATRLTQVTTDLTVARAEIASLKMKENP